jgi:excisionase family DNA binding protein
MSAVLTAKDVLSVGEAASLLGCKDWHLQRLFARGLVAEPARAGRQRLIERRTLPALQKALLEAGYLLKGGIG